MVTCALERLELLIIRALTAWVLLSTARHLFSLVNASSGASRQVAILQARGVFLFGCAPYWTILGLFEGTVDSHVPNRL